MQFVRTEEQATAALAAADLSGAWTLNLDPDFGGEPDSVACTFTQDGVKLTIRCGAGAPGDGEVAPGVQEGRLGGVAARVTAGTGGFATPG